MKVSKIHLVYFSATYTTRKVVRELARQIEGCLGTTDGATNQATAADAVRADCVSITPHDITNQAPSADIVLSKDSDLLIVGMPVYAGRIPSVALAGLQKFKSNGAPAIVVCVYGNRDYDDALLELKDIVEANGSKVISAGAFIAQHSIFPQVGAHRPDNEDMERIDDFAHRCAHLLMQTEDAASLPELQVKGNKPYKIPTNVPLHPTGNRKCDKCGVCVKVCPTQAIPEAHPRRTDKSKCISCGRCIVVCPQKARRYKGILYKIAGNKFTKAHSARKEPEWFFT